MFDQCVGPVRLTSLLAGTAARYEAQSSPALFAAVERADRRPANRRPAGISLRPCRRRRLTDDAPLAGGRPAGRPAGAQPVAEGLRRPGGAVGGRSARPARAVRAGRRFGLPPAGLGPGAPAGRAGHGLSGRLGRGRPVRAVRAGRRFGLPPAGLGPGAPAGRAGHGLSGGLGRGRPVRRPAGAAGGSGRPHGGVGSGSVLRGCCCCGGDDGRGGIGGAGAGADGYPPGWLRGGRGARARVGGGCRGGGGGADTARPHPGPGLLCILELAAFFWGGGLGLLGILDLAACFPRRFDEAVRAWLNVNVPAHCQLTC